MHAEAREFIREIARERGYPTSPHPLLGLDLGGRETNGHARDVFGPHVEWYVVDAVDGPGVDEVADAATFRADEPPDIILCAEVFEHTPKWPLIVANAYKNLPPRGVFICTMAGPGREVHGLNHDDPDQPGYYENIEPKWLLIALRAAGFSELQVRNNPDSHDVYGYGVK